MDTTRDRRPQPDPDTATKEAEERLRLALDAVGDGAWDWDVRTGAIYYSDGWYSSLGYARGETVPLADEWGAFVHPEDADVLGSAVDAYVAGRTAELDCEFRVRTKSGDYRWMLARGRAIDRDEHGVPTRIVGINIDISLAKSVQSALDQAEGRCRAIVDTAGCIIVVLDAAYRVREWNPAAERIYGWSADEARGKDYLEWFLPKRFREPVRAELVESAGRGWAVVAIGQDITERNKALRARDVALHEKEVALDRARARESGEEG